MIDFTKPVRTKNGTPVTILSTDIKNTNYPVTGIIHFWTGFEANMSWTLQGGHVDNMKSLDLENIPEGKSPLDTSPNIVDKGLASYDEWEKQIKNAKFVERRIATMYDKPFDDANYDVKVKSVNLKDPKQVMAYLEAAIKKTRHVEYQDLGKSLSMLIDSVKSVIEANKEPEQPISNEQLLKACKFYNESPDGQYDLSVAMPILKEEIKRRGLRFDE
ncbi:MAG: hypothetical protein PHE50_00100 [Dehalococcoidales bacterium]|nr:hypothetical protein [Dehalococcoidales bacterium]